MHFEKNCPGVVENGGVSGREQTVAARREKTMVAREGWRIPQISNSEIVVGERTLASQHVRAVNRSTSRSWGLQQRFIGGHLNRGHSITQAVDLCWCHQQVAFVPWQGILFELLRYTHSRSAHISCSLRNSTNIGMSIIAVTHPKQ